MTTTEPAAEPVPPLPRNSPADSAPTPVHGESAQERRKRPIGTIIAIVLLTIAVAATAAVLMLKLIELDDATTRISEQDRQIEEQRLLIETKETFSAAMRDLVDVAFEFDGSLVGSLVAQDRFQSIASRAWSHRWHAPGLNRDIAAVLHETEQLRDLLAEAAEEVALNRTGTTYEAVMDELGAGFVASLIDDADTLCKAEVLACVSSDRPRVVHFDAAGNSEPYMTDWIRTGIAYHEFAHVLQMTNPIPTEVALASFSGNVEVMADCFALTYLDGWTLAHRTWTDHYNYWDIDVGYGHVCDDAQTQSVRDWYGELAFRLDPITQ